MTWGEVGPGTGSTRCGRGTWGRESGARTSTSRVDQDGERCVWKVLSTPEVFSGVGVYPCVGGAMVTWGETDGRTSEGRTGVGSVRAESRVSVYTVIIHVSQETRRRARHGGRTLREGVGVGHKF